MSKYQFTRLENGRKIRSTALAQAMKSGNLSRETWLFVSPHDDDIAVGGGLWVAAAAEAGVHIEVVIVTDGRMGYCSEKQRKSIVKIRRQETYESFEVLGVPRKQVHYIAYPDGGLFDYQGRRAARRGEKAIEGHVGLQNTMTWHLRRVQPTRLLTPSAADLHPDHRITNQELMISIFHAAGVIWPELGKPLAVIPPVYDMAVYCDFAQKPNLELRADAAAFERKLQSIMVYRSQAQIMGLVDSLRKAGAYEYLREIEFPLYSPEHYKPLFK